MKRWKIALLTLVVLGAIGVYTHAQTLYQEQPYNLVFRQNNPVFRYNGAIQYQNLAGTVQGSSPKHYAVSVNPTAITATVQGDLSVAAQAVTITGIGANDKIFVNGPAPTAACPLVHVRVTGANAASFAYLKATTVLCTPASGTYHVIAVGGAS